MEYLCRFPSPPTSKCPMTGLFVVNQPVHFLHTADAKLYVSCLACRGYQYGGGGTHGHARWHGDSMGLWPQIMEK